MIIIGIDPSMSNTGLVKMDIDQMKVIDSLLIETEKTKNKQVRASSDTISRCQELYTQSINFVKQPFSLVMGETPSGSQSASGAKNYGISCMLLAMFNVLEVTPHEVKMASVGSKTASKLDIIKWAMGKHPEVPWIINTTGKNKGEPGLKNEHLADAIAVIYAGMQLPEFKRLKNLI